MHLPPEKYITRTVNTTTATTRNLSTLCVGHSVVSDSVAPHQAPLVSQATILEWIAIPFFRDIPDPGIEPRSPAL